MIIYQENQIPVNIDHVTHITCHFINEFEQEAMEIHFHMRPVDYESKAYSYIGWKFASKDELTKTYSSVLKKIGKYI